MDSNEEKLEALLRMTEPAIADDGFSEAVLGRLPPKRLSARTARCLSLAAAACIGSLVTLVGASPDLLPLEILSAGFADASGLTATLLTAAVLVALLMVPAAWLLYMEAADRR